MENNLKFMCVCIYIYIYIYTQIYIKPNHFAVYLKLTQCCKSAILQQKKKKEEIQREQVFQGGEKMYLKIINMLREIREKIRCCFKRMHLEDKKNVL